jgi:6-phosphogluconolactonase
LSLRAAPNARTQARWLAAQIAAVLERKGGTLALPGGTTPGMLYDALARADAGWARATVTLTDERWVPPHSAASNARLLRKRLLVARARRARFVPLKTRHRTAALALGQLRARLAPCLPLAACVLGMGEDGHIASLFPGGFDPSARTPLLAIEAEGAAGAASRVSLSLRTILGARLVMVMIRGDAKRAALARHLAPDAPPTPVHTLFALRRRAISVSWSP